MPKYRVEWFLRSEVAEFNEGAQKSFIDAIAGFLRMPCELIRITDIERVTNVQDDIIRVTTELPAERADWLLFVSDSEDSALREFLNPLELMNLRRKSHSSLRWIVGRKLPTDPLLPDHENEVSELVRKMRESRSDSFQWWHPSLLTSFLINLISGLVEWYRSYYFWPRLLTLKIARDLYPAESIGSDIPRILFRRMCWFRLGRIFLFSAFPSYVFFQYFFPHLSINDRALLLSHLIVVFLFLLILSDNLLAQWAELATFLRVENMTVISILLCRKSSRDSLWEFRRLFMNGIFGPSLGPSDARKTMRNEDFKDRMEEHLEELSGSLGNVKAEVFRLAILPLRHVFALLIFWGVMVMSLQLHCGGEAFTYLHLQIEESRTISTFGVDMVNCLYLSAGTVATNSYGEIYPELPSSSEKEKARSSVLKSASWIRGWVLLATAVIIITILGTFNLAFRSVDVVMRRLQDRRSLEVAIKDFVSNRCPYPLIQ